MSISHSREKLNLSPRRMIDVGPPDSQTAAGPHPGDGEGDASSTTQVGETYRVRHLAARGQTADLPKTIQSLHGRRTRTYDTPNGPMIQAKRPTETLRAFSDIALGATIQAGLTQRGSRSLLPIKPDMLRRKVRAGKIPNLVLFVVDASGSMAARKRMTAVKGAILSLLLDAYQKRDRVGLIIFRGQQATTILPPTNSISLAHQLLTKLPTGGKTPLGDGLSRAIQVLDLAERRSNEKITPLLVLISDGRANVGEHAVAQAQGVARRIKGRGWSSVVIDCESGYPRLGLAQTIGDALGGQTLRLADLSAESISKTVLEKQQRLSQR